jgi:diguanylate cyclase (GGDEF)-like protein
VDELFKSVDERNDGDFFGFSNVDIKGKKFQEIVPKEIAEIIDDNIEFTQEGNDFKSVVEKIIRFKIFNNKNEVLDMNAFVERKLTENDVMGFELILEKKIHLKEKIKSILSGIHEVRMIEHKNTKLMNSEAYNHVLDEILDFLHENKIVASMMVISIDGYPMLRRRLGRKKIDELLKKISHSLKVTFRTRDIIAYLGVGNFAVTMVKTFPDEVVHPLKRLEQNFRKEGVFNSSLSINARYKNIDLETEVNDLINQVKSKEIDKVLTASNKS